MKNYVRVLALYNEEGDIRPVKMEWEAVSYTHLTLPTILRV